MQQESHFRNPHVRIGELIDEKKVRINVKCEAMYSVAGRVVHRTSEERREDGVRESNQSRRKVLLAMKQRGFTQPAKLAVGDGALGFWAALSAPNGVPSGVRPTAASVFG